MSKITFGNLISDDDVKNNVGFIYLISVAGKKYLGKKQFLAGSNWKIYKSSSDEIKSLLKTNEGKFEVIALAQTKTMLSYLEEYYQFINHVLIDDEYVNKNVGGRYYRGKVFKWN